MYLPLARIRLPDHCYSRSAAEYILPPKSSRTPNRSSIGSKYRQYYRNPKNLYMPIRSTIAQKGRRHPTVRT